MNVAEKLPFSNTSTKYSLTVVGNVYYKDRILNKLMLIYSTANSSYYFAANNKIVGVDSKATANVRSVDDFPINLVRLHAEASVPASTSVSANVIIAAWNGSSYVFDTNNVVKPTLNETTPTEIKGWDARILSRSTEVLNTLYSNTDLQFENKSLKVEITASAAQSSNNLFTSPSIDDAQIHLYSMQYATSSNTHILDANGVSVDTEVFGNGNAKTRHISTKASFANNKFAEDLVVYMTAYRPTNTEVKVYARLHNSADTDAFDDKAWTPLVITDNANVYSSTTDRNDYVDYALALPPYSNTAVTLPGIFTAQYSNNIVVPNGVTPTSYLANNDVIKIYDPLIPTNYIVAVAASVNSTAIVLGDSISNNNISGSGYKIDRLKYPNIAFRNYTNDNVARYYNTSLVEFDTFDSYQIKIVLNSNSSITFPRVSNYQAIGVSV